MANEQRVRVNNAIGLLGASLGTSDTTITFTSAPPFPNITSAKHLALVLEPDTLTEEIVYVTAYTAGQLTATILRGQEGSTPAGHAAGMPWVHGPTKRDFASGRLAYVKRTSGDIAVASASPYRDAVLADSPAGYWRLGEASGTVAADTSGNARTGTFTGGGMTLGVTGLIQDADLALSMLAAQTGYVDLGNPAAWQATTISVECWFKTSQNTGRPMLVAKFGAWRFQILNGIIGVYTEAGGDKNSTVNVADGLTHHAVMTYQSGVANGLLLYLDGTLIMTATASMGGQGNNMLIGWDASNAHLVGIIDEVAFYPSILSQARITAHYNAGATAGAASAWKAVDTTLDLVVPALPGDIIEVGLDAAVDSADAYFDVASIIGGAVVNYWGATGGNTDLGIPGWAASTTLRGVRGPVMRQVTAADISAGAVTLRLMTRPTAGITVAASATRPLQWYAKNHGAQESL